MKLSYAEQLKHPKWQRRRLEALESAGFECECCGSKDKTLHVHHKQYFKGRMAWEYELWEFEVLCEECHADAHFKEERIKSLFVSSGDSPYALLYGSQSSNDSLDQGYIEEAWQYNPYGFMQGYVAMICGYLSLESMCKVAKYAASLSMKSSEARMRVKHDVYIKRIEELGDEE